MDFQPGQMLSHYRLVKTIGEGGMGVIWMALDTKLNRNVAIKILPSRLTADQERRLRFQREAQMAASLSNPAIAVIHEVGEHEGTPYLVMELLSGRTLRDTIDGKPLALNEWLRIGVAIADGLAHAHKQGIVHRDLKSSNVMVTEDRHVKLLDFGLAKLLEPEAAKGPSREIHTRLDTISKELTRAGSVLGTVAYMSPEQARGEPIDHRSDIFSFGIMLYEMATGKLPFHGKSDIESLNATITQDPPSLSEMVPGVPLDLDRVVRKAMEKEPERRYQHVDELATDLRNLQRDLDTGRTRISGAVVSRPAPSGGRLRWIGGSALAVLVAVLAALLWRGSAPPPSDTSGAGPATGRKMIAVLPFENLGPPEDEYFAEGMTEEITSRLATVNGLGVISRKSAMQYAGTDKSTKQIGQELGVDYVLEGTVRWARNADGPSRVRITPQLIHVVDDTHVWAERYDEVIDDIFEVQASIAGRVIEQLGVTLLEPDRRAVESRPTGSIEAYQAYVRGKTYAFSNDYTEENYRLAVEMFERAVSLDDRFALAYTELSIAHAAMVHFGYDPTPERRAKSRAAVERAAELAPDAPEVDVAWGWYHYWCFRDYDKALEAFARAEEEIPSDSQLQLGIGSVYRRQGRWEDTLRYYKKALELDPLGAEIAYNIADTYEVMREFPEAIRAYEHSIALAPDQINSYRSIAGCHISWEGSLEKARGALETMPRTDELGYGLAWIQMESLEGRYEEALERFASLPGGGIDGNVERPLIPALLHLFLGREAEARSAFESARDLYEKEIEARPEDPAMHSKLGIALAGLGEAEKAIREGKRGVELYPVSLDAFWGPNHVEDLALIYVLVGDHESALDRLESILSIPSHTTVNDLKLDPAWAPLRDHPRFRKLEERFG